jgi:chloramphenicol O-acetyltransferase type A
MMNYLDTLTWNRRKHFDFFKQFSDPYFSITVEVDVTKAYTYSKENKKSFFALYLHACIKAVNSVENFKYRIEDEKVAVYPIINVSTTILRPDNTFGFSYILFDENFDVFNRNFEKEKERVFNSNDLFSAIDSEDCVYCSALPWVNFSGHKEPLSGFRIESVPKLAFGKYKEKEGKLLMPLAISVNHALMDGYHVGLFFDKYQKALNNVDL